MANFEKFGHFLTALAMKKCIGPFCKIWPFFQWQRLFCHQNADGNSLAGAIVPPVQSPRSMAEIK